MDPHAFIAEVYRRMALRHAAEKAHPTWEQMQNDVAVKLAVEQYAAHLPSDKSASILDIGFGGGWFLAACLKLGYTKLHGADFNIQFKDHIRQWAPDRVTLYEIRDNIGEFLGDKQERYDFIHMSHVIEHVPKYSLLWVIDALYFALRPGGRLLLRTPNMEGPCANSSFYVTLSHEYGFAGSNLISLLGICGFDDVRLLTFRPSARTTKQLMGDALRWPFLKVSQVRHRLFGVNRGGHFNAELVAIASRGDWPPYFDPKYK